MTRISQIEGIPLRALLAMLTLIMLLLTGCAGLPPIYSVIGLSAYQVKSGDTLYSIAFRHGLDYRSLAKINGILPPYLIYPDQVLRLRGSAKLAEKDGPPDGKKSAVPAAMLSKNHAFPSTISRWSWPIKGEILERFSLENPVNKGIDISGKEGEPVRAAADGVVVYAGGNLRGYGKLLIVKHTDNLISAYGNNKVLLVAEGDEVKTGQSIARVGVSIDNRQMLHFEIRRQGKPVDPMGFLPSP